VMCVHSEWSRGLIFSRLLLISFLILTNNDVLCSYIIPSDVFRKPLIRSEVRGTGLIAGYHRLGLQENYNAFLQGVGYWKPDLRCRDIKKKERK
jgi:hypothetical protein